MRLLAKIGHAIGFGGGDDQPVIRYAHWSHNPDNAPEVRTVVRQEAVVKKLPRPVSEKGGMAAMADDAGRVETLILDYLKQSGSSGEKASEIDLYLAVALGRPLHKGLKDWFRLLRNGMKSQGLIDYNSWRKVWYVKTGKKQKKEVLPVSVYDLTEKEKAYLESRGLGPGWRRIEDRLDAVRWLHKCIGATGFEHFSMAILSAHCKVPVRMTEKRKGSNADGGLDGIGTFMIGGKEESVAVQAKLYDPDHEIGENHADAFVGAMLKHDIKHGFFITTAIASKRFIENIEKCQSYDVWIEMIDQEKLIDIMLMQSDHPYGFGLHQTELGLYYINEAILRKAGQGA